MVLYSRLESETAIFLFLLENAYYVTHFLARSRHGETEMGCEIPMQMMSLWCLHC